MKNRKKIKINDCTEYLNAIIMHEFQKENKVVNIVKKILRISKIHHKYIFTVSVVRILFLLV